MAPMRPTVVSLPVWPVFWAMSPFQVQVLALWPTVPITHRHAVPAFTGAGQRKGVGTCDMTGNLSGKQRRETLRCVEWRASGEKEKKIRSNRGKP